MVDFSDYQVFLFDFDGLLVDTEPLHYASYLEACRQRGVELPWDYEQYCERAHGRAAGVRVALQQEFPQLFVGEGAWEGLYQAKKVAYLHSLQTAQLQLMPGVPKILSELVLRQCKRAVVTNSPREHIEIIQARLPVLQTIPLWITREDYTLPKPAPDGYLKAIAQLAAEGERVIGFEDTMKGLKALVDAGAKGVLICPAQRAQVAQSLALGAQHFESFEAIV